MKKEKLLSLIDRFAAPVIVTLCGLILLFSPDTASALVARILSVILLIWAIGSAIAAVFGSENRVRNAIMAVGLFAVSRWLGNNPLGLAAGAGRILGFVLVAGAVGGFLRSNRGAGRVLYLVLGVLGLVLLVLPMTASRLVFILCGLAITAAGIAMFFSRFREQRWLDGGDDPNIIDAL